MGMVIVGIVCFTILMPIVWSITHNVIVLVAMQMKGIKGDVVTEIGGKMLSFDTRMANKELMEMELEQQQEEIHYN